MVTEEGPEPGWDSDEFLNAVIEILTIFDDDPLMTQNSWPSNPASTPPRAPRW